MTPDANRMYRRTGITSREAVALSGLSNWTTLEDIYKAKVDDIPLPDGPIFHSEMMRAFYTRQTGLRLERHQLLRHSSQRFALADPGWVSFGEKTTTPKKPPHDGAGVRLGESLVRFVVAQKTAAWGPYGSQIIPEPLYAECQWDAAVAGLERVDVVVQFPGAGMSLHPITVVPEIFVNYYSLTDHFMSSYALPNIPPPTVSQIATHIKEQIEDAKKASAEKAP